MKFILWWKINRRCKDYDEENCAVCDGKDLCAEGYYPKVLSLYYKFRINIDNKIIEPTRSLIQNIIKKKYICSKCGLIELPFEEYASIKDAYGWRKRNGLWICHHCDAHKNDCVKMVEDKFVKISQKEFDENWKEYVKEHNKKYNM
jgi:hypothetical protein